MKSSRRKNFSSSHRARKRQLRLENLENRSLLAGDVLHNFMMPEDTDGNGSLDPLDALVVINQLNQSSPATGSASLQDPKLVDVDADNSLTPLDALVVINQINASNAAGMRASRVDVERRIERIELAIASNKLPPNITPEIAGNILETLRTGGRPELGDRVVGGLLHWKQNVIPAINERADDQPDSSEPESALSKAEHLTRALSERLSAFGVTSQVINTISSEIKAACETDEPMDMLQIRDRLAELGVDVDKILPQPGMPGRPDRPGLPDRPDRPDRPDQPERPIMPTIMVTEPIAEAILARLKNSDVSSEVIETISSEIWGAIKAETPMSLHQVRSRLEELGVDWEKLHSPPGVPSQDRPDRPDRPDQPERPIMPTIVVTEPIADSILARMKNAGITSEVIDKISTEIWDAIRAGTPLDIQQVRARLEELGVDWERLHAPPHHPMHGRPESDVGEALRHILPILGRMGLNREVILTIYNEARAAAAKGTPMTGEQIIVRLKELGVSLDSLKPTL